MRFSRSSMYKRRAVYKKKRVQKAAKPKVRPAKTIEKVVKGDKNGGKRIVPLRRKPKYYPTEEATKNLKNNRKAFSQHVHKLRKSIHPGQVLILVAGKHKGKRVVFLQQLKSGLLLVTGPFTFNGVPLRRMSQRYVIATKLRVDISKLKVPQNINDAYFKRAVKKRTKATDSELFESKKEVFVPNEQRKADQKTIDSAICGSIKARPDAIVLKKYLRTLFRLQRGQAPHKMKF